jgi:hypothetical protein
MDPVVCPELYNRLKRRFGGVIVANAGARMALRDLHLADGRRKVTVDEPGEYYRVNCPFCSDTRKRLWVNHRFSEYPWLAHCFNETYCLSGHDGRPRRQRLFQMLFDCNRPFKLKIAFGDAPEDQVPHEVDLPGEIIPLPRLHWTHPANQYLRDRGYDVTELDRMYGVGYCQEAEQTYWPLSGRIFIPVVMRGELVGWQGRWPQDLNWKQTRTPKYYNLRGMPKRRMLYNFDNAKHYSTVVLVEGVTDVWSVGPMAVSLLGSELTSAQSDLLCEVWRGGTCVVMLDGDAQENNEIMTRELSTRFGDRGGRAFSLRLPPDKDPGDLSRDVIWDMISYEARRQGAAINLDWRP